MTDIAGEAGKVISDNARTLAPAAVGSQVGLMTVVSVSWESFWSRIVDATEKIGCYYSGLQSFTPQEQGLFPFIIAGGNIQRLQRFWIRYATVLT